MNTILVTGGAGFIGSHLCERLLGEGNRILCLDNLMTGSRENISHLEQNKNFVFIKHDIVDPYYTDEKINQIYNLACPASPPHYQTNSVRTIKINTIGVINVLGLARAHNARILQTSTSEVYGDPEVHPQKESYFGNVNPFGPRACYDEGKRCAEALFYDYKRMHNMEIKIARIFNTYGPLMAVDDGRAMTNFITQALHGKLITIFGDGSKTRSFCYVDDLVDGLEKLMNSPPEITGPINLGNPEQEITMIDFVKKIIDFTNSKSEIKFLDELQDDPSRRKPDITLARELLGWEPKILFGDGLTKTVAYFKTKLAAQDG